MRNWFAQTRWHPDDVLDLRPKWTKKKARKFLMDNEKSIRETMIEAGWIAIESLLEDEG